MRRFTILLLLALLSLPGVTPADPSRGPIDDMGEALRRAGFTSLYLPGEQPSRVSVDLLPLRADLDGDGTKEIFTKDHRDIERDTPLLTARKNGIPLWSTPLDDGAWLHPFDDINSDGGSELLVYQAPTTRVAADVTGVRLDMLDGRTGKAVWSYPERLADVSELAGATAGLRFWPEAMPDASGDGIDDIIVVTYPESADVPQRTTACGVDGRTGLRASRCIVLSAVRDRPRIVPVPDASGDGLADVLTYTHMSGDRHVLEMYSVTGSRYWVQGVDSRYAARWPTVDYLPGQAPGRIMFGASCSMVGCHDNAFDVFDARTGMRIWHRYASLITIGDVDGDGGTDLRGSIQAEDGTTVGAVVSSASGGIIYRTRPPSLPTLEGYRDPSENGWLTDDSTATASSTASRPGSTGPRRAAKSTCISSSRRRAPTEPRCGGSSSTGLQPHSGATPTAAARGTCWP